MKNQVKRDYSILKEAISPENVLAMSELIALHETKYLIHFIGAPMIEIHNRLYADVMQRNNPDHVLSDSYDLVQTAALYLCEHMGQTIDEVVRYTKKGYPQTIEVICEHKIEKVVNLKFRDFRRHVATEDLSRKDEPRTNIDELCRKHDDYSVVDAVIERMGLNELQTKALTYRMNGMSYPEIGRMVNRCQATIFEMIGKFKAKFNAVKDEFGL